MITMEIATKYVITDTKQLISPIGHDHTQPIYIQTNVAIHCDKIPPMHMLPKNTKLYVHDVEKIINS